MRNSFRLLFLFSVPLSMLVACGGDGASDGSEGDATAVTATGVSTHDAWVREAVLPEGSPTVDPELDQEETPASGVISALYLALENNSSDPVQLVAVETDVARVVEMHQTQNQNGLMQMRPVASVEIAAGGEVVFEPGGFHIMLIDVNRPLEPGDDVAVTLVFNTGERLDLPAVPVRES